MMQLELLDAVSDGAHSPNEDAWGVSSCAAWVLDGASGVDDRQYFDANSDAAWLSNVANHTLKIAYTSRKTPKSPAQAFRIAAASIVDAMAPLRPAGDFTPPSAAVSIAQTIGLELEVAGLGDVTVVRERAGRTKQFENTGSLRREVEAVRTNKSPEQKRAMQARMRERRRSAMNRPDGYWILGDSVEAADHLRIERISIEPGDRVLIMSDGFARVQQVLGLVATWADLFTELRTSSLVQVAERVRNTETADPECERFPRSTAHDDATAVLLKVRTT